MQKKKRGKHQKRHRENIAVTPFLEKEPILSGFPWYFRGFLIQILLNVARQRNKLITVFLGERKEFKFGKKNTSLWSNITWWKINTPHIPGNLLRKFHFITAAFNYAVLTFISIFKLTWSTKFVIIIAKIGVKIWITLNKCMMLQIIPGVGAFQERSARFFFAYILNLIRDRFESIIVNSVS